MNFAISRFTLDLQESQSQVSVPCLFGDTARIWLISLSDGGIPYTFEGSVSVLMTIQQANGSRIEDYCLIERNQIKYDLSSNDNTRRTAQVEGIHSCQITLFDENGDRLGTAAFTLLVKNRAVSIDDDVITEDENSFISAVRREEATRQANEIDRQEYERLRQEAEALRQEAFETYLRSVPKIVSITLLASAWEGAEDPYTQVVSIEGVTENTKVDLQPSADQLAIFHDKDLAFVTENDGGVVTVFAIGDKPTQDYTIQATLKEVQS